MSKKRTRKLRRRSAKKHPRPNGTRANNQLSFELLEARHLLASFTINSAADLPVDLTDGVVTLRDAIQAANDDVAVSPSGVVGSGADTITFAPSVFTGGTSSLIRLTQGELEITEALTIDGSSGVGVTITGDANGDDITNASNITDVAASFGTIAGVADDFLDDNSRVLYFSGESGDLTLQGLTVTGGRTTENVVWGGGGIFFLASGQLTIRDSKVSGNSTTGHSASGGGIGTFSGAVTLTSSTVSGNSTLGRFAFGGGVGTHSGTVTLTGSTVSGNSTMGRYARGGGIHADSGALNLTSSTVSGNSTTGSRADGGGIGTFSGEVTLNSVTVTGNDAGGRGGGIGIPNAITRRNITIENSIVAWNTDDGNAPDLLPNSGSLLTINYSLIGVVDNLGTITGNVGNQLGTIVDSIDPLLGPLVDNGGLTQTHALLPGSRAIDTGFSNVAVDQRGLARSVDVGSLPNGIGDGTDIGAFERQSPFTTFVPSDVTVDFETQSDLNFSAVEIIQQIGGEITVTLTASSGTFAAPVSGTGVLATLANQQVVVLVGSAHDVNAYLDNRSNLQYTAAAGLVGEDVATINVSVDSGPAWVVNVDVSELPGLNVTIAGDITADDGETSLREAIAFANSNLKPGADIITFDGLVFIGDGASLIRLTQGELEITETLAIDGSTGVGVTITGDASGDDIVTAENITDVAASFGGTAGAPDDLLDDNSRVLHFSNGTGDLTLHGIAVTGGRTITGIITTGDFARGGGILFESSGRLELSSSEVSGNSATGIAARGGGIHASSGTVSLTGTAVRANYGGGILSSGAVTLKDSIVGSNKGGGISTSNGAVTLTNSTVTGNRTTGIVGGGISTNSGEVTLTRSTVSDNFAEGSGGGIKTSFGAVTLVQSTVSGNNAAGEGGGIYTSHGPVTLTNSSVSDNSTTGFAHEGGGIYTSFGAVILTNSLVSGNSTSGDSSDGGGVSTFSGAVTLMNSSISGNVTNGTSSDGGGISTYSGLVTLIGSTLNGNEAAGAGGGVFVFDSTLSQSVTIENSIVAGNIDDGTAPDLRPDPESTLTINHSLIGVADNLGAIVGNLGNQLGTVSNPIDPQLGPLADNGGPTMTQALLPGSPAIDAGDPVLDVNGPDGIAGTEDDVLFDQRGIGFDRVLGGRVDIGAFEFGDSSSTPPRIVSAVIDDGGVLVRPDLWRALTVQFDSDVSISAEVLLLTNDTLGGTAVDLSQATFVYNSSIFTATWTFDTANPLPADFYTYTLEASSITAGGLQLDGNRDGTGGDSIVTEHYVAIPGDANLDGKVDVLGDAFALVSSVGTTGGAVWGDADFNGDGIVSVLGDAFVLVGHLGQSVIPPAAMLASDSFVQTKSTPAIRSAVSFSPILVEQEEDDDDQFGLRQHDFEPTPQPELAAHQTRDLTFESDFASDPFFGF